MAEAAFDVFLSHNSKDKPEVERLALRLRDSGLRPWLDRWCLTAGGRWQDELADGLRASTACAVFVGAHGLGDWVREELGIALDRAAKDRAFRLFLVLLPGVPEPFDASALPPFLSTRTWVDLRGGTQDDAALKAIARAIHGLPSGAPAPAVPSPHDVCPYSGLKSFDVGDAPWFFGRDADIQRLLEKLKAARLLAVLGASGSGKSSLVRAGLVPALRRGALPGSADWEVRIFMPGARPLTALAAQMTQLFPGTPVQDTLDRLVADERCLHLATAVGLAGRPELRRVVWVVDQFEEVFTLCTDAAQRSRFIDNLLYAAGVPGGADAVVLTMRSDFYPRCAAHPELAARIAAHQSLVGPLDASGLRQAIEEPARRVGLEFVPGLVETLLDDVALQPGALPLLEHALLELWERRSGGLLTRDAYQAIHGVKGAMAVRAEAIFTSFDPPQQAAARRLLLRLTQPGDGTEDTRRRASWAELDGPAGDHDHPGDSAGGPSGDATGNPTDNPIGNESATRHVIAELSKARLTTADEQYVEVSHEALIRGWPRLRGWIDEDRAGLRLHRRLTEAAAEWERLGRPDDEGLLYRGARLAQVQEWRERPDAAPNGLETAFVDASLARQQRETQARDRARRRTVIGLCAGLAVALLLAGVAGVQWRSAYREGQVAIAGLRIAEAGRIDDPDLLESRFRLVAEAAQRLEAVDRWSIEVDIALRRALAVFPKHVGTFDLGVEVGDLALSADGRHLLAGRFVAEVARAWDIDSGRLLRDVQSQGQSIRPMAADLTGVTVLPTQRSPGSNHFVAATPDGRYVVTEAGDGSQGVAQLWDTEGPKERLRIDVKGSTRYALSDDARWLATSTSRFDDASNQWVGTGLQVWDVAKRQPLAALPPAAVQGFTPDGRYLITDIGVWDTSGLSAASRPRIEWKSGSCCAVSADSGHLARGTQAAGIVETWSIADAQSRRLPQAASGVPAALAPGGSALVLLDEYRVELRSVADGQRLAQAGMRATSAAVTASGVALFAYGAGNRVDLWQLTGGSDALRVDAPGLLDAAVVQGRLVTAANRDGRFMLQSTEVESGRADATTATQPAAGRAVFSADGSTVAVVTGDRVQVLRSRTGDVLDTRTAPAALPEVALSPDGRHLALAAAGHLQVATVGGGQPPVDMAYAGVVKRLALAPGGDRVAAVLGAGKTTRNGEVHRAMLWSVADGRPLQNLELEPGRSIRQGGYCGLSPDARYLVTSESAVIDLSDGRQVGMIAGSVSDCRISADASRVAAVAEDGSVRIWSRASGEELMRIQTDFGAVHGDGGLGPLQFDTDGRYLVTLDGASTVQAWMLRPAELVAQACSRLRAEGGTARAPGPAGLRRCPAWK